MTVQGRAIGTINLQPRNSGMSDPKRDAIPSQQKLNEQAVLKRLVHHPSEVCGYIMAPPVGYRTYDCTLPRGHSGEHQSAIWA